MSRKTNLNIPDALKHFDDFPDSARVRCSVVQGLFGYSAATVWRRVRSGLLPAPSKAANCTTWSVGELRKALKKLEGAK